MARIILPQLPTLLGNFCKSVKIIHFSSEVIFGRFFTGHTAQDKLFNFFIFDNLGFFQISFITFTTRRMTETQQRKEIKMKETTEQTETMFRLNFDVSSKSLRDGSAQSFSADGGQSLRTMTRKRKKHIVDAQTLSFQQPETISR